MEDRDYMRIALEEADRAAKRGEVPIGAVVVYEPIDPGTRRPLAAPASLPLRRSRASRLFS